MLNSAFMFFGFYWLHCCSTTNIKNFLAHATTNRKFIFPLVPQSGAHFHPLNFQSFNPRSGQREARHKTRWNLPAPKHWRGHFWAGGSIGGGGGGAPRIRISEHPPYTHKPICPPLTNGLIHTLRLRASLAKARRGYFPTGRHVRRNPTEPSPSRHSPHCTLVDFQGRILSGSK